MTSLHYSNFRLPALSHDQQAAVDLICKNRDTRVSFACLTGAAGTGKTFTVKQIINTTHRDVVLTATTNKAARILSEATGYRASTIHSELGLGLKPCPITGKQKRVQNKQPKFIPGSLLVVDEASMIDCGLLTYIMEAAHKFNLLVLFVGDHCQLPPVGNNPDLFGEELPIIRLTTIHRQALENPIIGLATQFRDLIEGSRVTVPELVSSLNPDCNGVEVVSSEEFRERIHETFKGEDDPEVMVCTYTNQCALSHNSAVRKALFGAELAEQKPILVGERLVVCKPVLDGRGRVLLGTDDEVIAEKLRYATHHSGIQGTEITLNDGRVFFVARDPLEANHYIEQLRKAALKADNKHRAENTAESDRKGSSAWIEFFAAERGFHDLRHRYVSTIHKAQGSTYKTVFIDLPDLNSCKDTALRYRLLYTALTRASHRVVINGGAS